MLGRPVGTERDDSDVVGTCRNQLSEARAESLDIALRDHGVDQAVTPRLVPIGLDESLLAPGRLVGGPVRPHAQRGHAQLVMVGDSA